MNKCLISYMRIVLLMLCWNSMNGNERWDEFANSSETYKAIDAVWVWIINLINYKTHTTLWA